MEKCVFHLKAEILEINKNDFEEISLSISEMFTTYC